MTTSVFRAVSAYGGTSSLPVAGEREASIVFNRKSKSVRLNWGAVPGQAYRVQYKDGYNEGEWVDVSPDVVAEGPAASVSLPRERDERLYRILVIR
jgi:hypothetical protein